VLGADEEAVRRQAALDACGVLNGQRDPAVDAIVFTAAQMFRTRLAGLILLGRQRALAKAWVGPLPKDEPAQRSLLSPLIASTAVTVIEDTHLDPRFVHLRLVIEEPWIVMVAAAALFGPDEVWVGALCAFDRTPRAVSDRLRAHLGLLARQGSALIRLSALTDRPR
jgi:GAF domain-containing protein